MCLGEREEGEVKRRRRRRERERESKEKKVCNMWEGRHMKKKLYVREKKQIDR